MCVLCDGPIKLVTEILLLVHLISAYPMFLNPPNQFFENILGIPLSTPQTLEIFIINSITLRFQHQKSSIQNQSHAHNSLPG